MRNIARTVHSGMGSQGPSGARGAAVAYAEAWEKVFLDDGLLAWHQLTLVNRFDSGTSPLDSSDG